jgi:MFS family permease
LCVVAIFFFITVLLFIPIGQATGQEMDGHQPTIAYIINILSSLAGIWLFSLISFLQLPPFTWYLIFLFGILIYFYLRDRRKVMDWAMAFGLVVAVFVFNQGAFWSPYSRLSLKEHNFIDKNNNESVLAGYVLNVQQVFYQSAINLSDDFVARWGKVVEELPGLADAYNLPYRLVDPGSKVLIVGSGMGNDVSAAIRNGAGSITAVEIDPVILKLGKQLHPEQPYQNASVFSVTDDARSFFEKDQSTYDLIAFGLLDSHSLLSSLSSVRLDSYVYTLESFQQVKKHLSPHGFAAVTFATGTDWLEERLGRMMIEVFGENHVWVHHASSGTVFIGSQNDAQIPNGIALTAWHQDPNYNWLPIPTDDWPYLYLRGRTIPAAYWQSLLVVGLLALLMLRKSFPEVLKPNWHLWLLGAAFLLIEFTSITRLALLFGTTWLVNALAISGVLIMILCANLIVLKTERINIRLSYYLLFASMALVYLFPFEILNRLAPLPRSISSIGLLSIPLFFSGLIFAEILRRREKASGAFASNLSGSVAGGILEYSSIWWGVQSLYILGAVVYILAFVAYLRNKS